MITSDYSVCDVIYNAFAYTVGPQLFVPHS